MRVFVAGATGVLGRRILTQFSGRGHTVVALARRPENATLIRSLGGEPRAGDLFDVNSLEKAAEGSEVVIHAATAIPTKTKTKPADWALNDRIRRDGVRALTSAAGKVRARSYLQQGVAWLGTPDDGSEFDEDAPPNPGRVLQSMVDAEGIVQESSERHEFAASVLRCGFFYAPDAWHIRAMGEGLVRKRMPIIGRGDGVWSLAHLDDAASAFVVAAESGREGVWHVVDDEPVTTADFLRDLAAKIGAPPPKSVSRWLARLAVGSGTVEFLTSRTRTSNARIKRDLGWAPRFPSYREGIEQITTAWKSEGFPR